ncbi:SDR family NAD(P)-dependent oxidoreductase [Citrobacter portucalensis]|uniref:SDR family NAD(P)-dependent oxidoreductase n=1 Tax=Citrobacter portucalensis TaxID=1639133 RepID=UPI003CF09560
MTQRTLIIGGATGIGFAVAQLLAMRGDHIILAGRHQDKLQHACQQLQTTGAKAESVVLDIADETQSEHLGRVLEPVDDIVVTAGSQAPGGERTVPDTLVKTTMNAALEAAVKMLAKELSPLRVNAISPGLPFPISIANRRLSVPPPNLDVKYYKSIFSTDS